MFFKGRNDFGSLCKIFLVLFSFSPLPSLFGEGLAITLCEFIGFIIRFTEAIVLKKIGFLFKMSCFSFSLCIFGFFQAPLSS